MTSLHRSLPDGQLRVVDDDDLGPEPWERQHRESGPAWDAFRRYRDMPPSTRSTRKLAEELAKSRTLIGRWCSDWVWEARVRAWDAHLGWRRQLEAIERVVDADQMATAVGRLLVQKAFEALRAIDGQTLSPNQAAQMADIGIKLVRLGAGAATEIDQITTRVVPDEVDEETRAIREEVMADPEVAMAAEEYYLLVREAERKARLGKEA